MKWLYEYEQRADGAWWWHVGPIHRVHVGDVDYYRFPGLHINRFGDFGAVVLFGLTIYRWDKRPEECR